MKQSHLKKPTLFTLALATALEVLAPAPTSATTQNIHTPHKKITAAQAAASDDSYISVWWPAKSLESGIENWHRYQANKKELIQAMAECSERPETCSQSLKDLMHMLEVARQLPNKRSQLAFINAGSDMLIRYDYAELKNARTDADHRTILQAINERRGVCDEQARLKLAMVEMLGTFAPQDIHFISVSGRSNGKRDSTDHAAVAIRLDGNFWVMNDQTTSEEENKRISWGTLSNSILSNSTIERWDVFLNYRRNSEFVPECQVFFPLYSYNDIEIIFHQRDQHNTPSASAPTTPTPKSFSLDDAGNNKRLVRTAVKTIGALFIPYPVDNSPDPCAPPHHVHKPHPRSAAPHHS